jgi:hypothetical protein
MFHFILHSRRATPNAPVTNSSDTNQRRQAAVSPHGHEEKLQKLKDVNMWQVGKESF